MGKKSRNWEISYHLSPILCVHCGHRWWYPIKRYCPLTPVHFLLVNLPHLQPQAHACSLPAYVLLSPTCIQYALRLRDLAGLVRTIQQTHGRQTFVPCALIQLCHVGFWGSRLFFGFFRLVCSSFPPWGLLRIVEWVSLSWECSIEWNICHHRLLRIFDRRCRNGICRLELFLFSQGDGLWKQIAVAFCPLMDGSLVDGLSSNLMLTGFWVSSRLGFVSFSCLQSITSKTNLAVLTCKI